MTGVTVAGVLALAIDASAVIVLALEVALFAGLASVDEVNGWGILDLPWWAWLLLAAPALLLMLLLLVVPRAELSPGRLRNVGVGLLGLLVASDAIAVGVLLAALAGSSAESLSAGDLLAHGSVVWLTNIITFGLLFWQLDAGGPRLRAERGRPDPDFEFPQDARRRAGWSARLSDYLYVSPHERDRGQPDGHDAADAPGQGPHGGGVADLLRRRDPRRRARSERAQRLTRVSSDAGVAGACCHRRRGLRHGAQPRGQTARLTRPRSRAFSSLSGDDAGSRSCVDACG